MSGRDGHLGDIAAALVDGALDGGTRDRALAHVAGCTDCRAEVDEQRRLKERLRRLPDSDVSSTLLDRLAAIAPAAPAGSEPALLAVPVAASPAPSSLDGAHLVAGRPGRLHARRPTAGAARRPGSGHPAGGERPAGRSGAGGRTRRVAGGVTALALGVAVVVAYGPLRHSSPTVSPPVGQFTVEHAQPTGGFPGADPGAGAVMTVSVNR